MQGKFKVLTGEREGFLLIDDIGRLRQILPLNTLKIAIKKLTEINLLV